MSRSILRRAIQLTAFAFAVLAGTVLDLTPPGMSQLLAVITAMVALTVLGLAAVVGKRSSRARRAWLFAAVSLVVVGAACGLWYQSAYSASVFVYDGDGRAHVAGTERTAAAERSVRGDPQYLDPNKLLFDAAGDEGAVWTAESMSHARTKLAVLYLAFMLSLTASVFAVAELVPDAEPAVPPPEPRAEPLTILFLAANPTGTKPLRLDQECAAIEQELLLAKASDHLRFQSKWAVTIDDVMRHLNDYQPAILHFSGHGQGAGNRDGVAIVDARDLVKPVAPGGQSGGIALEDRPFVPAAALAKMIHSASPTTRLVVLNACYSADLGNAITTKQVDCVVGMRGAIADTAARVFAVGFYRALGHRCSVANAVDQAVASLAGFQLPDADLPTCVARAGVDADKLLL